MTKYSKSPLRGSGRLGRLRIKTCGDDREDVTADVGFAPQSGHARLASICPLSAKSGHSHCSQKYRYSITSSVSASSVPGISSPSAFAVFRLMSREYFVGCSTGRSAGFSPLRIRPQYKPTSR